MKRIQIRKLKLLNFCGIRDGEYEFCEGLTTISAGNGRGKTTIANAVSYVLFGTDSKGNAIDIKTLDTDRNVIREIPHEAALTLLVDDQETELKRTLDDTWKGDECKNTFKYYINGEVSTAGDYRKCVNAILDETVFAWIVNPARFQSEDWKTQRAFLQSLVPDVTADDITKGDHKFDFVVEYLQQQDIDKLIHHLRYKRNEVQKQLDEIPVRLQELNKAMPQAEDFDSLQQAIAKKETELVSIDSKISAIKNGAASQIKNESVRHRLEFARKRIDQMTKSAHNQASKEEEKHISDLTNARIAQSKAKSTVEELQSKMRGYTETEIQLNKQMDDHKRDIKDAGKLYQEANAEQWVWDDEDSFCPTCGQPLPIDRVSCLKDEAKQRFNERKAKRLKELIEAANKIKDEHAQCKRLMDQLDEDRRVTTNQLVSAQKAIKEADAHLKEVELETTRSYTDILSAKDEYKQVTEEISNLEAKLEKPSEGDAEQWAMLEQLDAQRKPVLEEVAALRSRLATKDTVLKITARIEEIQKAKAAYQDQIDELDQQIDIANEYNQLSCSILENRVNAHFKYVKWSLFRSTLDGDRKPYCECYHDGVPYSRLNGAAKVNAGIDIAYTIGSHYDVSAPMILDECESNLHPISRGGQQIRLYVTADNDLKFDYPAPAVME